MRNLRIRALPGVIILMTLLLHTTVFMIGCSRSEPSSPSPQAPRVEVAPPPSSDGERLNAPLPTAGTLLLLHDPNLESAARAWAAYRRQTQWDVTLLPVMATSSEPEQIRRSIQEHYAAHVLPPFAVLLLGDVDAIASWQFAQPDPVLQSRHDDSFTSDSPYQCVEDPNHPEFALGRIPASSNDDAEVVLRKIKRYEQRSPRGTWRRHVTCAAGEGRFGGMDLIIEMLFMNLVQQVVPASCDFSMTYANTSSLYCPPPDRLNEVFLERLSAGSLLFNYVGHGRAEALDRLSYNGQSIEMLDIRDLDRLPAVADRRPIALMTCCSAGWFDLPGDRQCLAEAMLFHPGGPVAVIAGSRLTHPYANTILQKDIYQLLLRDRLKTAGALDLQADRSMLHLDAIDRQLDGMARRLAGADTWASSLSELRQMHVRLYNLLGDPALRIAHPDATITDMTFDGATVRGYIDTMIEGTISISVETSVASFANRQAIRPTGPWDNDFALKAAHNYDLVNDRVLRSVEGRVMDGQFAIHIPGPLPVDAAVIKGYAVGVTDARIELDAIGALTLE